MFTQACKPGAAEQLVEPLVVYTEGLSPMGAEELLERLNAMRRRLHVHSPFQSGMHARPLEGHTLILQSKRGCFRRRRE